MLLRTTSRPATVDHNARAGSGNIADLVVGVIRQHPVAALPFDTGRARLPAKLPDSAAA